MGGTNSGGGLKIFRPTKMLVFAMVIVFLTFLRLGIKFSRWGKNSLGGGGGGIHQVGTSETVRYVRSQLLTSTIQSLCISIPETL